MINNDELVTFEFNMNSADRAISLRKAFHNGEPMWSEVVPFFKDFLNGMGYVFPSNTEFVLMPCKE